jgi:polygalacturonase
VILHLIVSDKLYADTSGEGGHGLSIGSLGSGGSVANVSNILFENAVMVNELYAARFKSWAGGKGAATKFAVLAYDC